MNIFQLLESEQIIKSAKRMGFYVKNQIFQDLDFKNKRILDIGGGYGLFTFYPALNGAKEVVLMEPEFDGSNAGMTKNFKYINQLLNKLDNIYHTKKVLEDFPIEKFDIILMHNSVNHIDEEACMKLKTSSDAQKKYLKYFNLLSEFCNEGTLLVICDCSNQNFWSQIGFSNPFSKSIEWHKHQSPKLWTHFLQQTGFIHISTKWTSPNILRSMGSFFLGNKYASYFIKSHFKMVLHFKSIDTNLNS